MFCRRNLAARHEGVRIAYYLFTALSAELISTSGIWPAPSISPSRPERRHLSESSFSAALPTPPHLFPSIAIPSTRPVFTLRSAGVPVTESGQESSSAREYLLLRSSAI